MIIISNINSKQRLKEKGIWTSAEIIKTEVNRGHLYFHYQFLSQDGQTITDEESFPLINSKIYQGKFFPVLYNSENPKEFELFILRATFDNFDLPYPDSLKWLDAYRELHF
jgi:hypothetical protein